MINLHKRSKIGGGWEETPHMIVKRFGCTAIHNKVLYKCIIHSFIQNWNESDLLMPHINLMSFPSVIFFFYLVNSLKLSKQTD